MTDLPDEFTVKESTLAKGYKCDVFRSSGVWKGQTTLRVGPIPIPFPPEEMSDSHAEHLYETYEVVDE